LASADGASKYFDTINGKKMSAHALSTTCINPTGMLSIISSVDLSEYSLHAHELDSTEKFVPIPLLNKDQAKYSRGVRPEFL
jgi:hypothetical protein